MKEIFLFCALFFRKRKNSNCLVAKSSEVSVRRPSQNENVGHLIKICFIFIFLQLIHNSREFSCPHRSKQTFLSFTGCQNGKLLQVSKTE